MKDIIIKKLTEEEIISQGIRKWPIWEKEISRCDWMYEGDEECLILEGEVIVETGDRTYNIKAGDFVTFKKGLKCIWEVKTPIKKHYNFP